MLKTIQTRLGDKISIDRAKEIASGGEGTIIEHPTNSRKVIKLYHTVRPKDYYTHLSYLCGLPAEFIKPEEVFFDSKGNVAGYQMPFVDFNSWFLFNNLFNKGFCNTHGINYAFKVKVLNNLRKSLEKIQTLKIIVGDLNQYNLFFAKDGTVIFVDTDSFASPHHPHSGVLLDDIKDWTTADINAASDAWAFDILSFWATTYCHPFKWVIPGNSETLEFRVRNRHSYLSGLSGMKIPPLYEPPAGEVLKQYKEVFNQGRRYMVSFDKTYTSAPLAVKQPVASISLNVLELFTGVTTVNACENYIAARINGVWTLVETHVKGFARKVQEVDCDDLYPSEDQYVYRNGNEIVSQNGSRKKTGQGYNFLSPVFYYHNGSLSILDYNNDEQLNINLNNQLSGYLDVGKRLVYAKSVILRDSPIQNFGSKKYLNIPYKNMSMLIEVPFGTLNAVYCRSFVAVEYRQKNTVKYILGSGTRIGEDKPHISLDYLPRFASDGDKVFIPENGSIELYINNQQVASLDLPACTRSSNLWKTGAGIVMLENNTLYLINTKK